VGSQGFSQTPLPQVVVGYPEKLPEPLDGEGDSERVKDTVGVTELGRLEGDRVGVREADPGLGEFDGDAMQLP
jgi:hypothetical protein